MDKKTELEMKKAKLEQIRKRKVIKSSLSALILIDIVYIEWINEGWDN